MKRLIALILAALLLSSGSVAYAETAKARVMRLEDTEGTVTLKKSSGVSLSISDGMKLYNGYKLSTGASSCAYVSLDSSKAVKLGSSASASVKKNGTKLELLLSSGKLYFNVSLPVASDESLKIRTSTTVTGIRGTAGEVRTREDGTTEILLLTGKVALQAVDPITGETRETIVRAGELATASVNTEGATAVTVRPLTETHIDGFAAIEIAKDVALQEKIKDETELDVRAIVDGAEERFDDDNAREKDAVAKLDKNESRRDDQMFAEPVTYYGPSSVTLTDNDFSGWIDKMGRDDGLFIKTRLSEYDIVNIVVKDATVHVRDPLTVPAGKTLNIASGEFNANGIMTVSGSLVVAAGAMLESTQNFTNNGTLTNNGTIKVTNCTFTNNGTVNNNGTVKKDSEGTVEKGTYWFGNEVQSMEG